MTLTANDSGYIARDDESEADRLELLRREGVGDTIFLDPEDVNNYALHDFGVMPEDDAFLR